MSGVNFCPQCGAGILGEDARFCGSCGAPLPSLMDQSEAAPERLSATAPTTQSHTRGTFQTCFKCRVPFDKERYQRCPRCFRGVVTEGQAGPSVHAPSGSRDVRLTKADDGLALVFHAFQVDTADAENDNDDIGIFESVPDAILGIAQYVLFDIARDHADWFLSGSQPLPWGFPHESETESMQLDWRRVSAWLQRHSADELVDWYRRAHPDLELFIIPRLLCRVSPTLDETVVMNLRADRYGLENLHLLRSGNLLPRL